MKDDYTMSTEFTQKIMFKGFMWIGIILLILITAIVLLALKPTVTVNNYVAAGDYSFDIGPNLVNYMDKVNQSIAQEQIIPSRKVDKVLAAYQQTLNNSNNTYFIAGPRLNVTPKIVINLSCVEETPCDCAKNTTTPCMAMCFKERNDSGCKIW